MAAVVRSMWSIPCFRLSSDCKFQFHVKVQCSRSRGSPAFLSDSVTLNGISSVGEKEKTESLAEKGHERSDSTVLEKKNGRPLIDSENGHFDVKKDGFGSFMDGGKGKLGSSVGKRNVKENVSPEKLEPLWDDGYGSQTVKDYLDLAKEMIKQDGGPPRWFCPVDCGRPLKDSPVLLFLPGT